jgi:hypothetical protein
MPHPSPPRRCARCARAAHRPHSIPDAASATLTSALRQPTAHLAGALLKRRPPAAMRRPQVPGRAPHLRGVVASATRTFAPPRQFMIRYSGPGNRVLLRPKRHEAERHRLSGAGRWATRTSGRLTAQLICTLRTPRSIDRLCFVLYVAFPSHTFRPTFSWAASHRATCVTNVVPSHACCTWVCHVFCSEPPPLETEMPRCRR